MLHRVYLSLSLYRRNKHHAMMREIRDQKAFEAPFGSSIAPARGSPNFNLLLDFEYVLSLSLLLDFETIARVFLRERDGGREQVEGWG